MKKKNRPPTPRNKHHAPRFHHPRMHGGESRRQTRFALHLIAQQEEPEHTEPARKEKIQPEPEAPHAAPGNQITISKCSPKLRNAVPTSAKPTARCRAGASTSHSMRSITRIPTCSSGWLCGS